MRNFTASKACRSRAHCRACRTDPAWRDQTGAPRECRFGVTADDLPPIGDVASISDTRLAICNTCGDSDCGIKHQSNCRRRAVLGRENFHCPNKRF